MRWPFRRKTTEPVADRPQGSVTSTVDAAPVTRAWAALPVIPVTIPHASPLVVGPAPVVPPLRFTDRNGAGDVAPAVGTVDGIARPVVRAAAPVVSAQPVAAPVLRRAVVATPTDVVPLVDAVDEYVGEPREPAEPHRAPGWLRFMPEWAKAGQTSMVPDLPMTPEPAGPEMVVAEPPSFLPPELRNPPKTDLPPRMAEGIQPVTETTPMPVRKRRPNLGQSRRLGLGAPISKPELVHPEEPPPIVDGTVESPQEPPSPPAAPARVMPEPEPEPAEPSHEPVAQPRTLAEALQATAEMIHPAAEPPRPPAAPTPPPTEAAGPTPSKAEPVSPAKPVVATYRATAELRPAPRRERPRGTVVDRVPPTLATEMQTRQQADVSNVPVYRGPKVGEAAKARGARAFAAGGAVFLPDEAGPVDAPKARGLLAHELVHAVQQRGIGPHLPPPDSPLGRRLEAEAQAAERFYSGEAGAEPPPLIHAPTPAPAAAPAPEPVPELSIAAQLATELGAAPTPTPTALHAPFDAVTTQEVGRIATESARHVVTEWANPRLHNQNTRRGDTHEQHHTAGHDSDHHTSSHGGGHGRGRGRQQQQQFNPQARREQLVAAALAAHNRNLGQGQVPLRELPHNELRAIDHQVDLEAARHGVSYQPPYLANSAESWMHAITGANTHNGFGLTGFREPVGTSTSWYESETTDNRPARERVADQMGLINPDTATQFDSDAWWQPPEQQQQQSGQENGDADTSGLNLDTAQLDELATRLYDRLRSRLRTELLVDRERAGLLTDFR
jgi:hypothetical protein